MAFGKLPKIKAECGEQSSKLSNGLGSLCFLNHRRLKINGSRSSNGKSNCGGLLGRRLDSECEKDVGDATHGIAHRAWQPKIDKNKIDKKNRQKNRQKDVRLEGAAVDQLC